MKKFIFINICLFLFSFTVFGGIENVVSDSAVLKYRTGEIDPRVRQIPQRLEANAFTMPELYLDKLTDFLVTDTDDSYLKVKRIHDWIADHIAYDTDLFYGLSSSGSRQPYTFLPLKRTTCGGYSRLFQLMAEHAGLESKYISGHARSYYVKSRDSVGNHAWNAVRIDGKWHIVDVTADNRRGYKYGKFSEKRKYSDHNLFISPRAKLITNLPYEEEDQLVENPITFEQYMAAPRITRFFLQNNLKFQTDIMSLKTEGREIREGGNQYSLFDQIELQQGQKYVELTFNHPDKVLFLLRLRDNNDKKYDDYVFHYRENGKTICRFSPPGPGLFNCLVMAKEYPADTNYQSVYRFRLSSKSKSITLPEQSNKLYDLGLLSVHGVAIKDSKLSGSDGYYMVDLKTPEGIAVFANIQDSSGNKVKNHYLYSQQLDGRKYYFSVPKNGDYTVKIYSKNAESEKGYNTAAVIKLNNANQSRVVIPPPLELVKYQRFYDWGFQILSKELNPSDGIYRFKIKSAPGYTMLCRLRNEQNKNVYNYYGADTDGTGIYDLKFSSPGKGRYTAKIYARKDGSSNTIAYFTLEDLPEGPTLPEAGSMERYDIFHSSGFDLVSNGMEKIRPGLYEIRIKAPPGMRMSSTLKDSSGEKYVKNYYRDRDNNLYTFHFSVPGESEYFGKIYQIDSNGKYSTIALCKISGETGPFLPAAGFLYRNDRFYDNSLKMVAQSISSVTTANEIKCPDCAVVQIAAPEGIKLACNMRDSGGNYQRGFYSTSQDGNLFTFKFEKPAEGRFLCRISVVDENGRWNSVLSFVLDY